jgi:cell division protein FtsB
MIKMSSYYCGRAAKENSRYALNIKILNLGLFLTITVFTFFYLISISDLTAKSFILQELRAEADSLGERQEFYEQQVNSLQSFYILSERAKTLNMVAIEDIEYIKASSQFVAKK